MATIRSSNIFASDSSSHHSSSIIGSLYSNLLSRREEAANIFPHRGVTEKAFSVRAKNKVK